MSFFSSLGKIAQKVVGYVAPLTALIPGVGGAVASTLAGAVGTPQRSAPVTTAGAGAGGVVQTLPTLGGPQTSGTGIPTPGGLVSRLGQAAGQFGRAALAGSGVIQGGRGMTRTKTGRLTGNAIPAGYVERMSQSGVVYLAKQRRGRGLSSRDIRGFYKVHRLVAKIHGRESRISRRRSK